ncbi:avirulence protein 1b [Phytophthora sojae]|uniref:RxLR effector protein n=2 Tax=Phytophthora sojae TaxID=67593 RepID=G4YE66_PHYSP|nr:avirulence protein 1b [Phytophthora sojae]AEK80483.1 Avh17 [Phytophthora sojae]AEK80484.1 Avh17 [Phytophthora sojae]AEK80485.1 Avh17 [Phytophthora sojae]EGZ29647.1 avirulence protein 1b [Phytophthora sojae]|eukprot:XP_009516922.1 avirulence protein 1b [Phytophthora sojae]
MRFAYVVLVSAVALLAGSNGLATAELNHKQISQVATPEAVDSVTAEQDGKRHWRAEKTEEKDSKTDEVEEEKGLFGNLVDNAIARRQYRRWYRARLDPREVKDMLKKRDKAGAYVDWGVANGYERYYRRRRNSLWYW